jgi:hypothetical protein
MKLTIHVTLIRDPDVEKDDCCQPDDVIELIRDLIIDEDFDGYIITDVR